MSKGSEQSAIGPWPYTEGISIDYLDNIWMTLYKNAIHSLDGQFFKTNGYCRSGDECSFLQRA
jgi:hypothetical protein